MSNEKITCRCRECGTKFRVRAEYAGKAGKCPNRECGAKVRVPTRTKGPPSSKNAVAKDGRASSPVARERATQVASLGSRATSKTRRRAKPAKKSSFASLVGVGVLAIAAGAFAVLKGGAVDETPVDVGKATPVLPVSIEPEEPAVPSFAQAVEPFLKSNCFDCHSGDEPEGDLNLASDQSADELLANRSRWEKALEMIAIGAMPPPDYAIPSEDEVAGVVDWLDHTLYHVDCEVTPDPGRVTVRRLNKTEYTNTVRDLFGIDIDPAKGFPSDEVGYGFDNIGDVLTVPPLLLEKYLDASEAIAKRVIAAGDPDVAYSGRDVNRLKTGGGGYPEKSVGHVVMSSDGAFATFEKAEFPRTAEYIIRIEAGGDQAGDELPQLEVKVGDQVIGTVDVDKKRDSPGSYDIRHEIKKGTRPVQVTFVNDFYRKRLGDRNAFVYSIEVIGPFGVDRSNLPDTHHVLTAVRPDSGTSAFDAAMANLRPLVRRAFRRAVSDADVEPFARFAALAAERGESFDASMQVAIQAVLVSPQFLFRIESDDGSTGNMARRLTAFELASRLSYFLWNTMPDEQLLTLAESNALLRTEILEKEVQRLLDDDRANEMVTNFVGQWLGLRRLVELAPDTKVFPSFNEQLRESMAAETYEFVNRVLRSGRPITELISARYSFLNERLAKHYGIEGVSGEDLVRVELKNGQRAGLLTQASILLLTSYPNRTSPVKRGEWVLTNILGDEPPPAPPNVPTLEETQAEAKDLTLREQMAKHREDPSCAACHKTMDAIGFGFESYDAIGRWRETDGKHAIDATGTLPTGESFNGAIELVDVLAGREDKFLHTFTERLLTFALGRGVEYTDKCVLDATVADAKANGRTFASIVAAIVRSDAFRYQGAISRPTDSAQTVSQETSR